MKQELRNILLSGALVAGSLGSAMVFAQANNQTTPAQTPVQTTAQPGSQMQTPAITGSVQVAQGAARYLDMAKVSLQDAVTAAQQASGATTGATSVELEVVNGYLVWNVTVGNQEILVDAGNGQVLQNLQAEAQDETGENETGENETMQGGDHQEENGESAQDVAGENDSGENDSD